MKVPVVLAAFFLLFVSFTVAVFSPVPTTLDDFMLPGSQPGESGNLENPTKCDNCHGGYDNSVEPAFNWRGSMMSQAARDPLFYAAMTIANQDAPESGDLCIRCHAPKGWLEGRSTPTDGSALTTADLEGVQCDFCHKMVRPTDLNVNPYPNDTDYTENTYPQDQNYLASLSNLPEYTANGMYIADASNAKRGPYTDAAATHQFYYSPFHRESALCGTCHDVSNPAFDAVLDTQGNIVDYVPNAFGTPATDFNPYTQFPIERTYSEWLKSAYNSAEGIPSDAFGGNLVNVSTCQDCHMKDVTGVGCNKNGVPLRDDLGLHDLTGANTFIPRVIDDVFEGEADTAALNAGILRARYMLQNAATMSLDYDANAGMAEVYVENQTGHKLPSGYPEGRRIWIHLRAWDSDGVLYESGRYETDSALLVHDPDIKVYEIKPGISPGLSAIVGFPAGPSFHFVLNDTIYKDNRIPPRGFTNQAFFEIQSPPVGYFYQDSQYWDVTTYPIPFDPIAIEATLYYQTASREYIEFLKSQNITNDWGNILYDVWEEHGKSTPELMQHVTWGAPIVDNDHDGYPTFSDCDDSDPEIYPGASELPDCLDNDCDGHVDNFSNDSRFAFWNGCANDGVWLNPVNWSGPGVPHDTNMVIIPSMIAGTLFPLLETTTTLAYVNVAIGADLAISPSGTLYLQSPDDTLRLVVEGDLENYGVVSVSCATTTAVIVESSGAVSNHGTFALQNTPLYGLTNAGMIENAAPGTFTLQQCDTIPLLNTPSGQIINEGIFLISRE